MDCPPPDNKAVAALFFEMADLLDIQGGERYRARAFRRAGHVLQNLDEPVGQALTFGQLTSRRGIGEGALFRIKQILRKGTCGDLERLRARVPSSVRELLELDGLGPRTVRLIHTHLGIASLAELERAALGGRLAQLPRFGARSQERLLQAIEDHRRRVGRTPLPEALRIGAALVEALGRCPGGAVLHAELAGSARRRKDLVGDLDVLVASHVPRLAGRHFAGLDQVQQVLAQGESRTAVRLHSGQRVDLRVLPPETFGAGLHYFTGSKRHNIAVRVRGNRRRLKISEHGIFSRADERRLAGAAERDVFAAIGLPFIPPELREDTGELEAAERGELPHLISRADLAGDLHVHTANSDGKASPRRMAAAAAAAGLRYLAITDHSRTMTGACGLDERRLLAQARRLRRLDRELSGLRLLCGVEVEILPDGQLDLDGEVLAGLDWVVASAHAALDQDRDTMTARLIRAMESGVVDCLGHPQNRLLGEREPVQLDLDKLLRRAGRLGVALELNADPRRLDLDAAACRKARAFGVKVVISSNAHHPRRRPAGAGRGHGAPRLARGARRAQHLPGVGAEASSSGAAAAKRAGAPGGAGG